MANNKARKTTATTKAPGSRTASVKQVTSNASQIVRDAALLLDEELAAGIVAAKQVQRRFEKERRIDQVDFKDAVEQFRDQAHELVNQLQSQFTSIGSKENSDVVQRLVNNTHSLLDLTAEAFTMGAELTGQITQSKLPAKPDAASEKKTR